MKTKKKHTFTKILLSCVVLAFAVCSFSYLFLRQASLKLYNASLFSSPSTIKIYYSNGELMEETELATSQEIPAHVKNAFIAIEDKRYYSHNGIDYIRIAGATIDNIKSGKKKEGASTITQQLIKNTHLSNKKSYSRKIKEYFLAQKLEKEHSKEEILTLYLNALYFGKNIYGIKNASKGFFSKSVSQLTLEEGALLAGIINSPNAFSPSENPQKSIERRNMVLNAMYKNNYINLEELESALKTEIKLNETDITQHSTQILQSIIMAECSKIANINNNLQVYTSINKEKQEILTKALQGENTSIKNANGKSPDYQALIINNQSGLIEAYQTNTQKGYYAKRQPASAIKPILVFAPALEYHLVTPATLISDTEINYNGYSPKNHDNKFHGATSVRECLSQSLNVPTVKLLDAVGIERAKRFAKNAGVTFDKKDNGYAIALGGFNKGITLLQTANTFQAIANKGQYIESKMITKIISNNSVVFKHSSKQTSVMREDTAYLVTDMLKTATQSGTSYRLRDLPFEVSAKTGTAGSDKGNTDAYSIAYTSLHTVAVWQGEINGGHMNSRVCGSTTPTKISREILQKTYKNAHPPAFDVPSSVKRVRLDSQALENGRILQADNKSRKVKTEVFSRYNQPKIVNRTIFEEVELPMQQPKTKKSMYQTVKKLIKPVKYFFDS